MELIVLILVILAVASALAFFRAPFILWTLAVALIITWTLQGTGLSEPALIALWTGFGAVALLFNLKPLRRNLVSAPLLKLFKKALPTLSATEREALEAGTVWWERELFSGAPDWKTMMDFPVKPLTEAERAFLDGPVEKLCAMIDDWETKNRGDLPPEVWNYILKERFFGLVIPKEYGGLGFSARCHSEMVMKVASRSVAAAVTVMVPNSLGPAELLIHYGTEEQKNWYLPRLARGEEIPCFALTAPNAGSDAGGMTDYGVICRGTYQGKGMLGIRLNWDKRYITLGPVATMLGLAFKLYDPDRLLGDRESLGITLALIPTGTEGIEIGRRHDPLGIPFLNGPNQGRDVFIPLDMIIGGPERAGQGWRMLMERLAEGRSISLPALSTGAGKLAARFTGAYARIRRQFKLPIGRFEGVQEALGPIAAQTYLMDAARRLTAAAVDAGIRPSVVSAMVKRELTERMRKVIDHAMDVHGGSAISMGPHNLIGPVYQSIPIAITVEGANILTRSMIVFGQGAIRAHPWLLKEMEAVQGEGPKALADFDNALFGHIRFITANKARAFLMGMAHRFLPASPESRFTRLSAAFAYVSDVALGTLGGALKRKEFLSGRLADVLANLYLGAAVLKRWHDTGKPEGDRPLMEWSVAHCLHGAEEALSEAIRNFPIPLLRWPLRLAVFPLGRCHPPPSDKMIHRAAGVIMVPSETRDRLTSGIFTPSAAEETMGWMEATLEHDLAAAPAERRFNDAVKAGTVKPEGYGPQVRNRLLNRAVEAEIITPEEARSIRLADDFRDKAIQVDHFPPTPHLPQTTGKAA